MTAFNSVRIENLAELLENFREILGKNFTQQLEGYNPYGLTEHEHELLISRAHPFARPWQQLVTDVNLSITNNSFSISKQSFLAFIFLFELKNLSNLNNFSRIINSLRNANEFYSARFEILIAASYINQGYKVEILPESSKRTSDFLITDDTQRSVYVECKSLRDREEKGLKIWSQITKQIRKKTQTSKGSWEVEINQKIPITGSSSSEIIEIIKNHLTNKQTGVFVNKYCDLKISKIAGENKNVPAQFSTRGRLDLIEIEGAVEVIDNTIYVSNALIINVKKFFSPDHRTGIKSLIRKANSQLPVGKPNIVHLEMPYKDGCKLVDSVDYNYDTIFHKLNSDHPRICAVVLSGTNNEVTRRDGKAGCYYEHIIIPNFNSNNIIPSNFKILGAAGVVVNKKLDVLDIPEYEGLLVIDFSLSSALDKSLGKYLINYSSHNGHYQLRVGNTFADKFRVEIVTPKLGRIYRDYSSIKLKESVVYKAEIAWKKGEISLSLTQNDMETAL